MNYHASLWPAYKQLLVRSDWPVLVGPFLGEAGIEALYHLSWIDSLKAAGVAPERLIAIGRGGSAVWYGCPQGIEVFGMRTPQQVRVENMVRRMKTGMVKQIHRTRFDEQIITDAAETLGLTRYHVLHPKWMYRILAPFWIGHRGLEWLQQRAIYNILPPPPVPEGVMLPEQFLAVKFYFRATFEYKHDALQLAKGIVKRLSAQMPIIVLNTDLHADDHRDLPFKAQPNVLHLRDLTTITPENSLWVQSAVMARAQGFVGTYGGLAQVAQRFGRPAVTFYTSWGGTMMSHKHLSDAISLRTGVPFIVQQVKDVPMIESVLTAQHIAQPTPAVVAG